MFLAFAYQMCRAVEQRCQGWNQERVRRELDRWLRLLIVHTWKDKHPHPDSVDREFLEGSIQKIKDSDGWKQLHAELGRVAVVLQKAPANPLAPHQGDVPNAVPAFSRNPLGKPRLVREPNPDMLKGKDIVSRKQAAEALGVTTRTIDRFVEDRKLNPTGGWGSKRFKTQELLDFMNRKKNRQLRQKKTK